MIEMSIDSIRVSMMNNQRVVILKEKQSERYLPIWIGPAEADAIAIKLQGVDLPRPLTHDLLVSVIDSLKASVNSITVSDLRDDTFYAKLILNIDGEQLELDSRPSDAVALAVRVNAPIYAEETVLDRAGILIDRETGKPITQSEGKSGEISEQELKSLSAFRDVIDQLNLEDLDNDQGNQGGNQG
ncbi:MAG: bifunctional nuclease family protein [Dehalococcoidia bacterium]